MMFKVRISSGLCSHSQRNCPLQRTVCCAYR